MHKQCIPCIPSTFLSLLGIYIYEASNLPFLQYRKLTAHNIMSADRLQVQFCSNLFGTLILLALALQYASLAPRLFIPEVISIMHASSSHDHESKYKVYSSGTHTVYETLPIARVEL